MLITTASFAAAVVALVGLLIFWSNPTRGINRAVCLCSLNMAAWLACWHMAVTAPKGTGLLWLRWTCTVGALAPLSFWLVKESILGAVESSRTAWVVRNWFWFLLPVIFAIIPFSDSFIPAYSTDESRVRGWGFYTYNWGLIGLYALLLQVALKNMKPLTGGRRLELQVWICGGCALAAMIYCLIGLSAITDDPTYRRMQPMAVLLFYAGTSVAITTHRIFDARQILLVGLEKITLVLLVAGAAYLLHRAFGLFLTPSFALLATTMLALWFAAVVSGWLDRTFHFYPQATVARQAAFAAAQNEVKVENLERAFLNILKGWGQTERVLILVGGNGPIRGGAVELQGDSLVVAGLRQLRWATPERLARERSSPARAALAEFLTDNGLGAVVIGEGPTLTAFVGVGMAASRRPFTYPQVTQLLELASIIESALERAHFSVKAQHAEQLATVGLLGASLAHEIRNPLVTIKTFVQLLPKHYQDAVFRDKFFTLIGDEVTRIDRLTEQLLDLASPRAYSAQDIELHPVLRTTLELVAAKASDKRIQFHTDFRASPDRARTDASAAKQVLLNLCLNAIQAVETQPAERWVKVSTRNIAAGVEMIVEDSGPGIAPEIRPRLFQPFQSTKSSGFGLGLAICSDILAGLDASIAVDPLVPGRGATFRIVFPCPA